MNALLRELEESQTGEVTTAVLFEYLVGAAQDTAERDSNARGQAVSQILGWLRARDDFADVICIRMLFQLLAKLIPGDVSVEQVAMSRGGITTSTATLRKHMRDPYVVRSCCEVLASLSTVKDADQTLARSDTPLVILEAMEVHVVAKEVLEDCLTCLAVMTERTRIKRQIAKSKGMLQIVTLLKRSLRAGPLVTAICRFICAYCTKDEYRADVTSHGGAEALIAAFDTQTVVEVRANISHALLAVLTDESSVQEAIMGMQWLVSLSAVVQQHPEHEGLHAAAIGIVRAMSKNPKYREEIIQLDFVAITSHALTTFTSVDLVKDACGLVGNLAHTDDETRASLGSEEIVQQVARVLATCTTHEHRKVAKLAIGALMNLVANEKNRDVLVESCDICVTLLNVTRVYLDNEFVLEATIGLIGRVVSHPRGLSELLRAGGVEALLLFLETNRTDLPVSAAGADCHHGTLDVCKTNI
jgi:hypothetical protein